MTPRLDDLLHKLQQVASLPFLDGDEPLCTYGSLLAQVSAWEPLLAERGIAPGNIVALRADYSLASISLLLALFKARAVTALLPGGQNRESLLRDSCAQWLCEMEVGAETRWQRLGNPPDHELLRDLRAQGQGGLVIFTSGTSGTPKAALHGAERFLAKFARPGRRMRTLAFLLFDHVAGIDTLFYTIANGGTLIVTRRRDPDSILGIIAKHRVEVLPSSPSFLRLMCLDSDGGQQDLSSLRVITYGSEPMDAATLARLNSRFPGVQLSQKYGTTETGSPRSVSRDNNSLWLRLSRDGLETRVVDGILWIRGEGTILGYLNAPSPFDASGWYCTGDSVETDGEWIRFSGRISDTINVGGEKVSPAEVEQVIMELDGVREAVVKGEPHPLMGQIVTARVVLAPGHDEREAIRRIREHCGKQLARHKIPVKIHIASTSLAGERHKIRRV